MKNKYTIFLIAILITIIGGSIFLFQKRSLKKINNTTTNNINNYIETETKSKQDGYLAQQNNTDDLEIIKTLISPSKKYEAKIIKITKQVSPNSKSPESNEDFPVRLILKNLLNNEEAIIAESTSPAFGANWTGINLGDFRGEKDEYLEYFVSNFTNNFYLYDNVSKKIINFRPTGHFDKSFWYNGFYIICSMGGLDGWGSSIIAIQPPEWENGYYIYPQEANTNNDEVRKKIIDDIVGNQFEDVSNCEIKNDSLEYKKTNGQTEIFNLNNLKNKK